MNFDFAYFLAGLIWFAIVWHYRWSREVVHAGVAEAFDYVEEMLGTGPAHLVMSALAALCAILVILAWPLHLLLAPFLWRRT